MKKLVMLVLASGLIFAQQQVTLTAVAPPPVQGLGNGIVGTPGTTLACYWVVTNYIGGSILSAAPTCPTNVPGTLSGTNYVQLSWQGVAGTRVTYDVLKTTTSTPPVAGASVALATGLTATTTNDQGGSLSPYTQSGYTYATGSVLVSVNNRDYVYPVSVCTGTTGFPCQEAVDQLIPKAGNQVVRIGGCSSPFTVDATGATFITEGSCTPGAAVGSVVAGNVYSVSATLTLAQVNAGATILPAVTGQTFKVSHFLITSVGGTTGGCTSVNISDTTGTPVNAAAIVAATLTSGTPVNETASGVTLTAFAPTALTLSQGIQVRHVGSACTTATSYTVVVYFTINS